MAQAGPPLTRRVVLAAVGGIAVLPGVVDARPATLDARFLAWERELDRVEAAPFDGLDDDAQQNLIDRAGELSGLILDTRSATLTAAQVKMRHLVRSAHVADQSSLGALEDIMTALNRRGSVL